MAVRIVFPRVFLQKKDFSKQNKGRINGWFQSIESGNFVDDAVTKTNDVYEEKTINMIKTVNVMVVPSYFTGYSIREIKFD